MRRLGWLALAALVACGDNHQGPGPGAPAIVLLGRLERSAVVGRRLVVGGDTVPDTLVSWRLGDTLRASLLDSARVRFDSAGAFTLRAVVGSDTATYNATVSAPPVIVFDQLSDSGNRDIWRADLDGLNKVRLTTNAADDRNPAVVGSTVTFISLRTGAGDLYQVPLTGGSDSLLLGSPAEEEDPAAASNGNTFAFIRFVGGIPKLFELSGGSAAPLTSAFSDGAVDASPSWSPAGDRVAFASSAAGPVQLWTVTMRSGALDSLPGHGASGADVEPAWSPDGAHIAFASSRDGPTELYLLTIASGAVVRLTTAGGTNGRPAWTADGRIVYVAFIGGHPQLRWLDPAAPAVIHDIPVGTDADHPASPW